MGRDSSGDKSETCYKHQKTTDPAEKDTQLTVCIRGAYDFEPCSSGEKVLFLCAK